MIRAARLNVQVQVGAILLGVVLLMIAPFGGPA